MDEDRTITLGGKEVAINPIDLGTMKLIGLGSARSKVFPAGDPVAEESAWYDGAFEVIAAATKPTPEETVKAGVARVSTFVGVTLQEIIAAQRKIYLVTGLVVEKPGKPKPGEENGAAAG